MKYLIPFLIASVSLVACSQPQKDPEPRLIGQCEGCEAVFEFGDTPLHSTDTLPDFLNEGVPIKVEGTIFQTDWVTPAEGVVLYVYHTDQEGRYTPSDIAEGWGNQHGKLRGWMKTGEDGKYAFYTSNPAPYPNRTDPAHIHYTVLEPDGKYYWLGSCHFEGDSLLTTKETSPDAPRGGSSGLLELVEEDGILTGRRDIVLGKNIPGYD